MVATFQAKPAIRATGLAMLSMLALLAVILVVESYNSDRTKAVIAAHRAAHVVAIQYDWMFEASAHALQRIEDTVTTGHRDAGPVIRPLGDAVTDLPAGFSYSVFNAAGTLTHSSLQNAVPAKVTNEPWFISARAGREIALAPVTDGASPVNAPAVNAPAVSPAPVTAFRMIRRLGADGTFQGVATVTIPAESLTTLAETLGLGTPSTIALVLTDGTLLARTPPVPPMNVSGWELFSETAKSSDGAFEGTSPADGIDRIIGYWQLPNWPVIALAGVDNTTALRPFWRNLFTSGILALPILLGMGWLVLDLTHLMRVDERRQTALTEAIERSHFLLREIHHRLKNNLQTVSSLIRMEHLPAPVQTSLLGRINAMVAVHEAMYRSDQFEEICIAPYLERLVDNIAQSHGIPVTVHIDIARIRLSGDRAMQLGLLVNELVSNAFKHAFAPRGGGTLNVGMQETESGSLFLTVADDGPGYDPATTTGQMGSRLIEAFAAQLGGSVTVTGNNGTRVTAEFPKDYGSEAKAPQRSAQPVSIAGVRSIASIRLSKLARSSKRT